MGKPDAFAALRLVSFRRYVIGRMMLSLGLQVQSVAVGWQLYERTGLAEALGYIGLAQVLPVFLFSLAAGQLADRVNRRSIILVAAGAQVLEQGQQRALPVVEGDVVHVIEDARVGERA